MASFEGDPVEYCDICQDEQAELLVDRPGLPIAYFVCVINGCSIAAEELLDQWEEENDE